MTEPDYVWLANENLPGQVVRVVAGSEWHYAQGGWVETDPVPELTAAEIEAAEVETETEAAEEEEPEAELAEDEQEPDPETPAQEES